MGSGASMALEEVMDEEYLRAYAGDRFDEDKFHALCNEYGEVTRDIIMSTVILGVDREVYYLFMSYATKGIVDMVQYLKLLRNAKLLDKKFTKQDAERIFHGVLFTGHKFVLNINYYLFRTRVIPEVAIRRELTIPELMQRLSACDLYNSATDPEKQQKNNISSKPTTLRQTLLQATSAIASISIKDSHSNSLSTKEEQHLEIPDKQTTAAIKLQKTSRGKTARRQIKELKSIQTMKTEVNTIKPQGSAEIESSQRYPSIEFISTNVEHSHHLSRQYTFSSPDDLGKLMAMGTEVILEIVFEEYCRIPHEMDVDGCKKMFREMKLITNHFTTIDVEIGFRRGLTSIDVLPDDDPLKENIFFGKRANFNAFRSAIIGILAQMRGITLDALLEILKQSYVNMHTKQCSIDDHGLMPDSSVN
jgi:hypothetical protein